MSTVKSVAVEDKKYQSRSATIVEAAESADNAEQFTAYLKGFFADDIRKARKFAENTLQFKAVNFLSSADAEIGFTPLTAPVVLTAKTKYTKKLSIAFSAKANLDYKSFIMGSLEKDGVLISKTMDKATFAFEPKSYERIVAKVRPLADVMIDG